MAKPAYTGTFSDGGPDTAGSPAGRLRRADRYGRVPGRRESLLADADTTTEGAQPGIGYLTKHVDGTPVDCATADTYFVARDPAWDGSSIPTNGNPIAAGIRGLDPLTRAATDQSGVQLRSRAT